jgi:hypothetical protein
MAFDVPQSVDAVEAAAFDLSGMQMLPVDSR